ncbi:MAG: DUF4345 domain-containing protein [Leptospirales bacterium]|jgi:hypothetical protein
MNIRLWTTILLVFGGVSIALIGLSALIAPDLLAAPLGFALDNTSALNEFRANYGGMLLLLGMLTAAGGLRSQWHRPALYLLLCFTAGLVLGRLVSIVLDGAPGVALYIFGGFELFGATAAALLLRCYDRDCPADPA